VAAEILEDRLESQELDLLGAGGALVEEGCESGTGVEWPPVAARAEMRGFVEVGATFSRECWRSPRLGRREEVVEDGAGGWP